MSSNSDWNDASESHRSAISPLRAAVDVMGSFAAPTEPRTLALPNIEESYDNYNRTNRPTLVYPAPPPRAPDIVLIPAPAFAAPEVVAIQFDVSPNEPSACMDVDTFPPSPPATPEGQVFPLPVRPLNVCDATLR